MRLIDGDALENQFGISDADLLALDEIRRAPTVDAEVVVRCKDCKYNVGTKKCLNPDSFFAVPKDNDFCSYGERKDNGNATDRQSLSPSP